MEARARLWGHSSKEAESGLGAEAGLGDGTVGLESGAGLWGAGTKLGSWEQEQGCGAEPLVLGLL